MKKVKKIKNTWLLELAYKDDEGEYQVRHRNYWNKTKKEIIAITNEYSSCYDIVHIYKLENIS